MMQNVVRNGYKIDISQNIDQNKHILNKDSELLRALHFLTAMEICETCIPANNESNLKLGDFKYKINYKNRIISVSE